MNRVIMGTREAAQELVDQGFTIAVYDADHLFTGYVSLHIRDGDHTGVVPEAHFYEVVNEVQR